MNFKGNQKEAVESTARFKLIQGCAGSYKTDTLIKCAIQDLQVNNRPILFLTLVGSVTFEIKERLSEALGIKITRQGKTNHYVGKYNGTSICISNFDAWVDKMLRYYDLMEDLEGNQYDKKTLRLHSCEGLPCINKNGEEVGLLILDEAQDLDSTKMEILVKLGTTTDLAIYIAGDKLQTIFNRANAFYGVSFSCSLNTFKELQPAYFDLDTCFRCPKGHVDFNNLLLEDAQRDYGLPKMKPANKKEKHKPFLFTHETLGNSNVNPAALAIKIVDIIRTLMKFDPDLIPNDILFISLRTNNSEIFNQLSYHLSKFYKSEGIERGVIHFSTESDQGGITIDWNLATGKSVISSIHAAKGKGFKCVFLLNLTHGSIPRAANIFKEQELTDLSLLNVGLTRSTKYLFVGFNRCAPSYYLYKKRDELSDFAYRSWSPDPKMPFIYRQVYEVLKGNNTPWWGPDYPSKAVMIGSKTYLTVTDIAKSFREYKDIQDLGNLNVCNFGNSQPVSGFQEDHYKIMGCLGELLIRREYEGGKFIKEIISNDVIFTEDEVLLAFYYDILAIKKRNPGNKAYIEYMRKCSIIFKKEDYEAIKLYFNDIVWLNRTIIHNCFKSKRFEKTLKSFINGKDMRKFKPYQLWNITLFYMQASGNSKMINPSRFISFLNEELDVLFDNVDKYVSSLNPGCVFETPLQKEVLIEDNEILNELKIPNLKRKCYKWEIGHDECDGKCVISWRSHHVGISGRADIVNENLIIEIKTSQKRECLESWIIQAMTYAILAKGITKICVVNILEGVSYTWNIEPLLFADFLKNKIQPFYDWHDLEVKALLMNDFIG